jgi:type IX secretion system PorP/SprF family membrane protein
MRAIVILAGMCSLVISQCPAQFVPNSSQSFQLIQAYNPAFTGYEGYTSVKLGYRSQWASFPGAPRFINAVASGRIKNAADLNHNALRLGAPVRETDIPKGKRIIHGVGANVVHVSNGAQGVLENTSAGLTYALHYPFDNGLRVSLGMAFNYESIRVRWDKLDLKEPNDPLVVSGQGPFNQFNVRTGLMVYTPTFYFHAAYYKLYTKTNEDDLNQIGYDYKGAAGIGLRLTAGAALEFRPSILAVMDQYDHVDIDYSVKMYYNDKAWGGFSYRDNGFASIILGFEFNSLVGVSYSYEISTGGLQGFNNGSSEFILGLKLANFRKLTPAVW